MTGPGITKATPLPSLAHQRAEPHEIANYTAWQLSARTCQFCKTVYRNGGNADQCEHYHYPIP
ncbi:hypothetical protein ACQPXB_35790 [Amycolatopsis sp. CA-161197]|uniref:hypothetical protein n=1 Tax=Amycolatopsis sp. CA-161197 TaxID=3239922 RepID=UPI003D8A5A98